MPTRENYEGRTPAQAKVDVSVSHPVPPESNSKGLRQSLLRLAVLFAIPLGLCLLSCNRPANDVEELRHLLKKGERGAATADDGERFSVLVAESAEVQKWLSKNFYALGDGGRLAVLMEIRNNCDVARLKSFADILKFEAEQGCILAIRTLAACNIDGAGELLRSLIVGGDSRNETYSYPAAVETYLRFYSADDIRESIEENLAYSELTSGKIRLLVVLVAAQDERLRQAAVRRLSAIVEEGLLNGQPAYVDILFQAASRAGAEHFPFLRDYAQQWSTASSPDPASSAQLFLNALKADEPSEKDG